MNSNLNNTIFAWRDKIINASPYTDGKIFYKCPVCKNSLKNEYFCKDYEYGGFSRNNQYACLLCGWEYSYNHTKHIDLLGGGNSEHTADSTMNILRNFDLNSMQLEISEVATHLKNNYADIYSLSWQNFEKLVHDIFKRNGYNVVQTQQTRDNGADILVFNKSGTELTGIIECKKYKKERKIGIGSVRSLVGAAIEWDVKKLFLVTSSEFSKISKDKTFTYSNYGYEIELIGSTELFKILEIYNENLPNLENINLNTINEIITSNNKK